ncbi:YcxB family protein [Thalassotalea sp. LPB0316]|uniref:YcxB family protein n=1 Tax=Thalassotalea sp. LPB0316 TaxID=2769490 RepID=UPI0018693ACA|nr:YcxB family protein [Thalassotalea sp. LPB0316]QOL25915.1 YcxB family protein [Thalassotalea sp. LPB0316]
MKYQHQFILDRQYYTEVYEQTAIKKTGWQAYKKAIVLFLFGLFVSAFATNAKLIHLSYFIVGLGVVEALSVRFAKTWWLWRQLMSKAANNPVELTIDEQGIAINSAYINQQLNWSEISSVEQSSQGYIFNQGAMRHYLSKSALSDEVVAFINSQGLKQDK